MPASTQLTPRVQQALDIWNGLSPSERNYRTVAEVMNITTGRASVYLRDAFKATGRMDEAPRGAKGNGASTVQTPEALMQQAAEQVREQIEQVEARATEAQEAAQAFDAEAFKAAEDARLAQAVKDAKAALDEWRKDEEGKASTAAEAEGKRLTDRAATVQAQAEEQLAALEPTLDGYEKALTAITAA